MKKGDWQWVPDRGSFRQLRFFSRVQHSQSLCVICVSLVDHLTLSVDPIKREREQNRGYNTIEQIRGTMSRSSLSMAFCFGNECSVFRGVIPSSALLPLFLLFICPATELFFSLKSTDVFSLSLLDDPLLATLRVFSTVINAVCSLLFKSRHQPYTGNERT